VFSRFNRCHVRALARGGVVLSIGALAVPLAAQQPASAGNVSSSHAKPATSVKHNQQGKPRRVLSAETVTETEFRQRFEDFGGLESAKVTGVVDEDFVATHAVNVANLLSGLPVHQHKAAGLATKLAAHLTKSNRIKSSTGLETVIDELAAEPDRRGSARPQALARITWTDATGSHVALRNLYKDRGDILVIDPFQLGPASAEVPDGATVEYVRTDQGL